MTNRELQDLLATYPDDAPVLFALRGCGAVDIGYVWQFHDSDGPWLLIED